MTNAFAPGDRVRYNGKSEDYYDADLIGMTGTVIVAPVIFDNQSTRVEWDVPYLGSKDSGVYTANLELIVPALVVAPEPEVPPTDSVVKPLEDEITRLKESLQYQINRATEARRQHEKDIKLIGETLIEKAEQHDMCSVFDNTIHDLNDNLTIELPTREREYSVEFTFTQTITVSARNADEALDTARDSCDYMDSDDLYEYNNEVEES